MTTNEEAEKHQLLGRLFEEARELEKRMNSIRQWLIDQGKALADAVTVAREGTISPGTNLKYESADKMRDKLNELKACRTSLQNAKNALAGTG